MKNKKTHEETHFLFFNKPQNNALLHGLSQTPKGLIKLSWEYLIKPFIFFIIVLFLRKNQDFSEEIKKYFSQDFIFVFQKLIVFEYIYIFKSIS